MLRSRSHKYPNSTLIYTAVNSMAQSIEVMNNKHSTGHWPDDVGILALEIYVPKLSVCQEALEKHDGVDKGKYTIGLGQTHMGFCNDLEDINSLSLTVVQNLLENFKVTPVEIGWLEVGTETIVDKSKSTKSVLMQLFTDAGNTNIEGLDTTNACFGATQALFNALAWIESSAWDGRYAIVVAGDIAVYAEGNARPTGGAGSVAMLIGPNAPLVLDRGVRYTHMEHVYDFYKPNLDSEYPIVDGKLSIQCFLRSLDTCYAGFKDKYRAKYESEFSLDTGDYYLFHSPFTKLVQKSVARLMFNDFLSETHPNTDETGKYAGCEMFKDFTLTETYENRELMEKFKKLSKSTFSLKTDPTLLVAKEVGNIYTGSLYGGIASLLAVFTAEELNTKQLVLFSYGSGLAASMYGIRCQLNHGNRFTLERLINRQKPLPEKLQSRTELLPKDFEGVLKLRETTHHLASYTPVSDHSSLYPGTYYLESCDEKYRRYYNRIPAN